MSNTIAVDETLDTSGLLCPLPVYKAGLVLTRLEAGKILHIITTDPGSLEDIPALARQRGDQLLGLENRGTSQEFWLKKGPIVGASREGNPI
jgi:tRNA 2-thiouridine synthesizing protein A